MKKKMAVGFSILLIYYYAEPSFAVNFDILSYQGKFEYSCR